MNEEKFDNVLGVECKHDTESDFWHCNITHKIMTLEGEKTRREGIYTENVIFKRNVIENEHLDFGGYIDVKVNYNVFCEKTMSSTNPYRILALTCELK